MGKTWAVYLSREIHTDWCERIATAVEIAGVSISMTAPVTYHGAFHDAGVRMLGAEPFLFRTIIGEPN